MGRETCGIEHFGRCTVGRVIEMVVNDTVLVLSHFDSVAECDGFVQFGVRAFAIASMFAFTLVVLHPIYA